MQIVAEYGHMDMIVANNVYAHIPDIQGTTRAINSALSDSGVFVFEVHYLDKVVNDMQYDMIYHEHIFYYSLLSAIEHFKRHDMVIFDVKLIPIHAGSLRFYVCKKNDHSILHKMIELNLQDLVDQNITVPVDVEKKDCSIFCRKILEYSHV